MLFVFGPKSSADDLVLGIFWNSPGFHLLIMLIPFHKREKISQKKEKYLCSAQRNLLWGRFFGKPSEEFFCLVNKSCLLGRKDLYHFFKSSHRIRSNYSHMIKSTYLKSIHASNKKPLPFLYNIYYSNCWCLSSYFCENVNQNFEIIRFLFPFPSSNKCFHNAT